MQAPRTRSTSASCSADDLGALRSPAGRGPTRRARCGASSAPRSRSRPATAPKPRVTKNVRQRRSPSSPSVLRPARRAACSAFSRAPQRGVAAGPRRGRRGELRMQRVPVRLDGPGDQGQPVGQPVEPALVEQRPRDDHEQPQVAPVRPELVGLAQDGGPVDRHQRSARPGCCARRGRCRPAPASAARARRTPGRRAGLAPDGFSPSIGFSHECEIEHDQSPARAANVPHVRHNSADRARFAPMGPGGLIRANR